MSTPEVMHRKYKQRKFKQPNVMNMHKEAANLQATAATQSEMAYPVLPCPFSSCGVDRQKWRAREPLR